MQLHRWMRGILATLTLVALSILPTTTITTVHAAGQVGNGSPASCTESALQSALNSGGTITFNCGSAEKTITVSTYLKVTANTVLDGGDKIILSGADQTTVLKVNSNLTVTLQNLTIQDGRDNDAGTATQSGGVWVSSGATVVFESMRFLNNDGTPIEANERNGGAIGAHQAARVTVRNSEFIDNAAINGGAIHVLLTPLVIEGSTFRGNTATVPKTAAATGIITGYGGAVYTDGAGPKDGVPGELTIRDSIFESNLARIQGGALAIFGYDGDVFTIESSTFSANRVGTDTTLGLGGAVRHANGPLIIRNTTFADNTSYGSGGAIWSGNSATLYGGEFTNVTAFNNRAAFTNAVDSIYGGAFYMTGGAYRLINSTLVGNHAHTSGGAFMSGSDTVTIYNTIIANNTSTDSRQCRTSATGSNNIQFPASSFTCVSGITHVDPQVELPAGNGGPTMTMALVAGSPAINAGNESQCIETDQRLADRVGACDIGAFEFGGVPPPTFAPNMPVLNALTNGGSPIVVISWGRTTRTTSYNLEVVTNGPSSASLPGVVSTTKTAHHFGLNSGSYQARIQACNLSGCSDYSAPQTILVTSDPARTFLPGLAR
jgi:predicted outer membrane repeat protein